MSTDQITNIDINTLKNILEASLLAAGQPLSMLQISALFSETERPSNDEIHQALELLSEECENRGIELVEVASGWRLQIRQTMHLWISRMWTEKPQRYSRALLETLALIAYRQPITRGEIEDVRGVSVSSSIIRTMQERDWIRVIGHRDVPGKPALLGTTRAFLDYFNLKSLDDLPNLAEIQEMVNLEPELDLEGVEREKLRQKKEDETAALKAVKAEDSTPLEDKPKEDKTEVEATTETIADSVEPGPINNE
ncbi:MAG: SMC-Scp complex subunit ScpB [Xanthomonadales bacterium]|nr:SMC-Scp complex subunit ScpB [Xanthomonadales bacterium]